MKQQLRGILSSHLYSSSETILQDHMETWLLNTNNTAKGHIVNCW